MIECVFSKEAAVACLFQLIKSITNTANLNNGYKGYNIYFQHDPKYLNGTLIVDDQGRYSWSKLR